MTDTGSSKPRRLTTGQAPPQSSAASPRPTPVLSYMHRPPRIMPNYGRRQRGPLPKSSVSRVLLYDNVTQQQMLHVKISHLRNEQLKTGRLMDMHRKSFIVRRLHKMQQMAEHAIHVDHELLEQGLLTASKPDPNPHPSRPHHPHPSSRAFNPYLTPESPSSGKASLCGDTHDTSKLTSERSAEEEGVDSRGHAPLPFLAIDRHRAITSDCLAAPPSPSPFPAPSPSDQRTAHTALLHREAIGHGNLPGIQPARGGKLVLHVHNHHSNGLTRILHTFPSADSWEGVEGGRGERREGGGRRVWSGGRTTEDERYRQLERTLVRISPPSQGYLALSPSFHHHPAHNLAAPRPPSLHPALYRRRRRSSSTSSPPSSPASLSSGGLQVQDL